MRSWIQDLKELEPCADCGRRYRYYQMDFDHLLDKRYNVGSVKMLSRSRKRIEEEISKCDIVCKLCHAHRTHIRRMKEQANDN